jgi:multiple sugar transport system substrate-binding protein
MRTPRRLTRRTFVRRSALLSVGSALLAACQQAPAPKPEAKSTEAPPPSSGQAPPVAQPAAARPTDVPKAAEPEPAAPAATAAPATRTPVTIQYWHINTEVFGLPLLRTQIQTFQQQHPGITIEERSFPSSYAGILEALQASMVSRSLPGVVQIGFANIPFVTENIPHTPIERLAQQEPETLRAFPETILGLGTRDGVVAGMPFSLSLPITFFNGDIFRAAGLDPAAPPPTWEQLRAAARTIKEKTGKHAIHLVSNSPILTAQWLIDGNGGRMIDQDGKTAVFNSPEAAEAMQLWADLALKDRTLPVITFREARQSFTSGDIAMLIDSSSSLGTFAQGQFDLRTAPFPLFGSKPRKAAVGGNCLYITAPGAAEQAAAWEWVRFLTSPEQMTLWVKETGYLPIRTGLEQDPRYLKSYYDENPLGRAALSELPEAVRWAVFPGKHGPRAASMFQEAQDAILSGQSEPATALEDAANKINALVRT